MLVKRNLENEGGEQGCGWVSPVSWGAQACAGLYLRGRPSVQCLPGAQGPAQEAAIPRGPTEACVAPLGQQGAHGLLISPMGAGGFPSAGACVLKTPLALCGQSPKEVETAVPENTPCPPRTAVPLHSRWFSWEVGKGLALLRDSADRCT